MTHWDDSNASDDSVGSRAAWVIACAICALVWLIVFPIGFVRGFCQRLNPQDDGLRDNSDRGENTVHRGDK